MKIFTSCMECLSKSKNSIPEFIFVDFDDNLIARGKCSKGHFFNLILQANKFEVFMDCGAEAINKEYPLEACFNFAMARESLFLFALEIMLEEINQDEYLKIITKQSERIIGAFSALYFTHFGKVFKFDKKQSGVPENIVNFRNNIVHKGKIPTLAESIAYGEAIYNEIDEVVQDLRLKYADRIQNHTMNKLASRYKENNFQNCSTWSGSAIYPLNINNIKRPTFIEKLIGFKEMQLKLMSLKFNNS